MAGAQVSAIAFAERQNGEAGVGPIMQPKATPGETKENEAGDSPDAARAFEEPAGKEREESEVIQPDSEESGHGHVEIRGGPMSGPLAGDANAIHQKPAGVIEQHRDGRKPGAEQKAGEIADEDESAQRNGKDIGRAA